MLRYIHQKLSELEETKGFRIFSRVKVLAINGLS